MAELTFEYKHSPKRVYDAEEYLDNPKLFKTLGSVRYERPINIECDDWSLFTAHDIDALMNKLTPLTGCYDRLWDLMAYKDKQDKEKLNG